jgi:hypothetical protein
MTALIGAIALIVCLSASANAATLNVVGGQLLGASGVVVAALFYSLNESAKLCGVEPRAYLQEATPRAVRNPGTVTLARDLKLDFPRNRGHLDG